MYIVHLTDEIRHVSYDYNDIIVVNTITVEIYNAQMYIIYEKIYPGIRMVLSNYMQTLIGQI